MRTRPISLVVYLMPIKQRSKIAVEKSFHVVKAISVKSIHMNRQGKRARTPKGFGSNDTKTAIVHVAAATHRHLRVTRS
jgi:ribosomal protein L23